MSGLVGTVTVQGVQWQRLDMRPSFEVGAFEAVLDLELFLDEEGRFRDMGWDFSTRRKGLESVLRKIHYVRYGKPNHPDHSFYFRAGALDDVTLGQGMIMRRYRNTQDAPGTKKIGLDVQVREVGSGRVTVRGMLGSLLDLDGGGPVAGGRVSLRPPGLPEIGATVVVDTDQWSGLPDSLRLNRSRDMYGMYGVDVSYPLVQKALTSVRMYGGVSRTMMSTKSGTGISGPGVLATLGGLTVQGEYRWVRGHFRPGHFDALYEGQRATVYSIADSVKTREMLIPDVSMQGIFTDVRLSLGMLVDAEASYQHLSGKGTSDRRLEGRAALKPAFLKFFPKVTAAEAYYENRRLGPDSAGFFEVSQDMRFGYRLGLSPVARLSIVMDVEFTYVPDNTGGVERQRRLNLQSIIGL